MALGAGLLLAAAAVELAAEVTRTHPWIGVAALLAGAATFSAANAWLSRRGAKHRKRCGECVAQSSEADVPNSGLAIAMGTAMDAVPEAIVLGLSCTHTGRMPRSSPPSRWAICPRPCRRPRVCALRAAACAGSSGCGC